MAKLDCIKSFTHRIGQQCAAQILPSLYKNQMFTHSVKLKLLLQSTILRSGRDRPKWKDSRPCILPMYLVHG